MMPARVRSNSASRIQKYFGVLLDLDSHEPEFLFCSGGLLVLPVNILVVLSPLDDDRLSTREKKSALHSSGRRLRGQWSGLGAKFAQRNSLDSLGRFRLEDLLGNHARRRVVLGDFVQQGRGGRRAEQAERPAPEPVREAALDRSCRAQSNRQSVSPAPRALWRAPAKRKGISPHREITELLSWCTYFLVTASSMICFTCHKLKTPQKRH